MPGPPPKRSDQRRRANKPVAPVTKAAGATKVRRPAARRGWHPIARAWYDSLAKSGQSVFYQPSDWATALLIAESISRELSLHKVALAGKVHTLYEAPRGASLSAWLKGMSSLMVTEGDRRRLLIELQRHAPESDDAFVSELDQYRQRRESSSSP